jgi:hypothetical protein
VTGACGCDAERSEKPPGCCFFFEEKKLPDLVTLFSEFWSRRDEADPFIHSLLLPQVMGRGGPIQTSLELGPVFLQALRQSNQTDPTLFPASLISSATEIRRHFIGRYKAPNNLMSTASLLLKIASGAS